MSKASDQSQGASANVAEALGARSFAQPIVVLDKASQRTAKQLDGRTIARVVEAEMRLLQRLGFSVK